MDDLEFFSERIRPTPTREPEPRKIPRWHWWVAVIVWIISTAIWAWYFDGNNYGRWEYESWF